VQPMLLGFKLLNGGGGEGVLSEGLKARAIIFTPLLCK
jgi:hypothetical protein